MERMTSYIADLLDDISSSGATHVQHVVDIGAGQVSNLPCVMCSSPLSFRASDLSFIRGRMELALFYFPIFHRPSFTHGHCRLISLAPSEMNYV